MQRGEEEGEEHMEGAGDEELEELLLSGVSTSSTTSSSSSSAVTLLLHSSSRWGSTSSVTAFPKATRERQETVKRERCCVFKPAVTG